MEVSPLTFVSSHARRFSVAGFDGEPDDFQNSESALTTSQTNQINAARAVGIPTESISGNTTAAERRRIENDLKCCHPYTRLLYITPELLAKQAFRKVLTTIHQQGQLIRVAIDEAHCIR
jgi:superfamily II DNA helicase RecQ